MMKIKLCDCGGKAEVHSWEIEEDDEGEYTFDMYYVECEECHKRIPILQFMEEDAIKLWNELYANMPREKLEEEVI